jgi:hypothetical protein
MSPTRRRTSRMDALRPSVRSSRHGGVVLIVVACLATFSLIALAMLRGSLASRGQLRSERHLRQADSLLDAAVARAASRIASGSVSSADDLDETLEVAAGEILGTGSAQLTLDAFDSEGGWQLEVVCEYPVGDTRAVRRRRTVTLPLPPTILSNENRSPSPEETVP